MNKWSSTSLIATVLLFLFVCNLGIGNSIFAQTYEGMTNENFIGSEINNTSKTNLSDATINHRPSTYTLAMAIGFPTGILIYGIATWDWGDRKSFHMRREGFLGNNTGDGGADKVGHAFSHYLAFRALHNYYDWSENGKHTKWYYSIGTAVALGVLIEVGDSYSSEIGGSYEDLVADLTGICLGILLEYSPTLDSLIGYSWQYWPTSRYYTKKGEKPLNFTCDYNGAKFVLNFRLAGFQNLGLQLPNFLRYIQLDFGYFTRNYRGGDGEGEPYRSLYYGVSLNFMEIVKDFFENPQSRASRISQQPFKYYHIPAGYHEDYRI